MFAKVRDARFFASCVEGVQELNEIDPEHYTAVLETRVAYLKFRFNVTVEVTRMDAPREIEAKVEGTPLGIVGRLTATSITRLADEGTGTRVSYEIDAALTGKLGSLGPAGAALQGQGDGADLHPAHPRRIRAGRDGSDIVTPAIRASGLAVARRLDLLQLEEALDARHRPGGDGKARGRMTPFELVEPTSLSEALRLLDPDDPTVRPIAGGTALMLMMKAGVFRPTRLVSLRKIGGNHARIATADGELAIGAMTTLSALERSAEVARHAPVIIRTMRRLSNVRVRNVATVGGELAHGDPHMDLPPVLIALGARVLVTGPEASAPSRSKTCSPAITRRCWARTN